MKHILSGNEAVARGAYEAGVSFASAYPGTPSTEILEEISAKYKDICSEWAPNEKVAMEAAIGASFMGGRSMAAMKMVGVNVAADPLFTFAYTGVNGGMVFISADDPGLHSSQNEQDNRYYARAARIAMLEPSDSQEAKDMMVEGFRISEEFDVPVMLRMTTRVCHSKSLVEFGEVQPQEKKPFVRDLTKYNPVPAMAKLMHASLEKRMARLQAFTEETPLNRMEMHDTAIGVITSGVAYTYAREVFGDSASYLKLGFTSHLPEKLIREFASKVDKLYVIEELEPYLEEHVRMLGIACTGKALIPREGELNPDIIRRALLGEEPELIEYDKSVLAPRPPTFCAGCPHAGFFYELGKLKDVILVGDIGCYALSGNPPLNAKDIALCMGAGFSVPHGGQKVIDKFGGKERIIGVMGDSTFFHTGMNSLLEAAYNRSRIIMCIVDNRTTGMTGHQENPGSGYVLGGGKANDISIPEIVKALGISFIRTVDPMDLAAVRMALKEAMAYDGPAVIVTRYPCALKKYSPEDLTEFGRNTVPYTVDTEKCIGCKSCMKLGCPAIRFDGEKKLAQIDGNACACCGVCAQLCPKDAIGKEEK